VETPIIDLQDIRKSFGPVEVLKGVNMQVYAGKVTALVGDNGAGKSTLIKGLSGAQPYDSGEVSFEGGPITLLSPRDASGHGIEVVYQDLSLCENLDIVQNMLGVKRFTSACSTSRRWRSMPRQRCSRCRSGP